MRAPGPLVAERPVAPAGPAQAQAGPAARVREDGRTVLVQALIVTGVNADRKREILGLEPTSAEDGAGWLAYRISRHE